MRSLDPFVGVLPGTVPGDPDVPASAANDDTVAAAASLVALAETPSPVAEVPAAWDPFEVWATRIRDPRRGATRSRAD